MSDMPADLVNCEVFLRAVRAAAGIEESIEMWELCRRHEWHGWEWDARRGEIIKRSRRIEHGQ